MSQLILYACPVGELATQIEQYFQESLKRYGKNSAHAYMPHCTLTGFFDKGKDRNIVEHYTQLLLQVFTEHRALLPANSITVEPLAFHEAWHGLPLQANALKQLIAIFAEQAKASKYPVALRLKDWLHLSLAYDFDPGQAKGLQALAAEMIDVAASVDWEIRFYEREKTGIDTKGIAIASQPPTKQHSPPDNWICHCSFPL
ncbi:MAG: hypothetical protein AAFR58_22940 [Cyanobacteria bacterium J06627_28]